MISVSKMEWTLEFLQKLFDWNSSSLYVLFKVPTYLLLKYQIPNQSEPFRAPSNKLFFRVGNFEYIHILFNAVNFLFLTYHDLCFEFVSFFHFNQTANLKHQHFGASPSLVYSQLKFQMCTAHAFDLIRCNIKISRKTEMLPAANNSALALGENDFNAVRFVHCAFGTK